MGSYGKQGWGQLFEMHAIAIVCSCEASVCSCNRSCSCAWPKISIGLAVAVVDDKCAAIAIVLAVVPSYNPSDRKSTRLNSSHVKRSRMPSSA